MGPDSGVQILLKTGVGSAGFYGIAGALWARSGTFFAEARVFVRGSSPDIEGVVGTIRVEASRNDLVISLLEEKINEEYGSVKWVHWLNADSLASR
jgi:hypothetical protein